MAPFKVGSVDVKMRDTRRPQAPPAAPKTVELPAGHKKRPDCRAVTSPIILDQDQILTLRDGVKIRADIYRPKTDEKVPAIVMWGPYGKSGSGLLNIHTVPLRAGIPTEKLSGYENFEGLDPIEWVPRGYAIVNIDARGVGDSEGDLYWWGTAEGRDGSDAIEELAKLPWCSGKVGLAGNSWLAISQYFIAAQQPPHLAAIAPLEGLADPFREESFRGGIPSTSFSQSIADILSGRQQQEDTCAMVKSFDTTNDYLEDKRVDFSKVQVPAYIGASYSSDLHGVGSLRAFEEIPHDNKWLVLHETQEWYDLYTSERTEDLNRFFDHYLKGAENDWLQSPKVRLALLNYTKPPIVNKVFSDIPWHLPSAVSRQLHLTYDKKLSAEKASLASEISYQADTADQVVFTYDIPSKTAVVGPSTLTIDISSSDHDDLDVYTHIYKADANGNILSNKNIPTPESLSAEKEALLTKNRVFRYWGPEGILRASHRHQSAELATKSWRPLSHKYIQKVKPGDVVRLEIQLWPTGIVFEAGEKLVLKISGEKIGIAALPTLAKAPNPNKGKHVLHVGGQFEGHLQLFTIDV
ncbi:x-pro dipeptidyl-peptidase c-terminal non-catalytic domain-containing protein [Colletotrichum truncatum]|uniref:X-pro dipeptidyl-peptidase c-terminal non-catalytic domain-containing protein n=1 Tax=Colletotrichum truncatum TaxID=5467 RepID=A0ACC3Z8Q4_COLTU|nr:x-pro dipeptidyl-peptidase c-terminal non-catalytic domain-containing protein [Colletotrichum truncatum]KAF6789310.1 x-pro dipeptidyl-peptidase c-terminal non-catalytic domain-containing protein [Colletotrichum truncatum]